MDKILLKPLRSEIQYLGRFANLAFGLLATPAALYQSLLKHLAKHGATLQSLKQEAPTLSDANISCLLAELSANSQVRLDRLEISFLRFHEVGAEIAHQIALDSWAAVHEADASITVVEHTIGITIYTQIQGTSYDQVIGRYVKMPPGLQDAAHAGVAFYLSGDPARGERPGGIVLDRLIGQDQGLLLKVTAAFDAERVPFNTLAQATDTYLTQCLDLVGLVLDQGEGQ